MQFTDLMFLFIFMPALLVAYYLMKEQYRHVVLLFMSLLFYACGSPAFLWYLCVSVLINILLAGGISRAGRSGCRRRAAFFFIIGILWNLGALGYYKYADFIMEACGGLFHTGQGSMEILIPLGISFYTFKAISYMADVYRGEIREVSFSEAAVYLSFFAQIQSGPISRYGEFTSARDYSTEMISGGAVRFMIGFSKKVLLANSLNNITLEIFDQTLAWSTGIAWLGAICYSLQLYYDFSGYSDMAIGVSNMLGIRCCENFRYPYASRSVSEFWRRWHISLGQWFRDYIYIPMGGSRVGKVRLYINLLTVWLLTGIWHGAGWNYIVWGLGFFLLIALEKTFRIPERLKSSVGCLLYRIFTLLFVNFQWVLFRSPDLLSGLRFIKRMCIITVDEIASKRAMFLLKDYWVFIAAALIFAVPLPELLKNRCKKTEWSGKIWGLVSGIGIAAVFLIAFAFVVSGQNSPFLYANF